MATSDIIHVWGELLPHKSGVVCIGGDSDDYVQVDAATAGQNTENYASGTWCAWIIPLNQTQTGTIMAMGDKSAVEFIELNVEAGLLVARCTDAATAAWVITSDAIVCPQHVWTHVALKHDGQRPWLYVNGVEVAQTISTDTAITKWVVDCTGLDSGRIGAANKAGDDSVTQEFGGTISDVRLYGGLTNVGAVLLNCACPFDSKFRKHAPITADYPVVCTDNNNNSANCWIISST